MHAEVFEILGESKILNQGFAHRFARTAGFRDVLAHDYEEVEAAMICHQVLDQLSDVDSYTEQVRAALEIK